MQERMSSRSSLAQALQLGEVVQGDGRLAVPQVVKLEAGGGDAVLGVQHPGHQGRINRVRIHHLAGDRVVENVLLQHAGDRDPALNVPDPKGIPFDLDHLVARVGYDFLHLIDHRTRHRETSLSNHPKHMNHGAIMSATAAIINAGRMGSRKPSNSARFALHSGVEQSFWNLQKLFSYNEFQRTPNRFAMVAGKAEAVLSEDCNLV